MAPGLSATPRHDLLRRGSILSDAICEDEFSWMNNEQALSPCLVSAYVSAACKTDDWTTPTLNANNHYDPPSPALASYCTCSWANYNLIEACTICQGLNTTLTWSEWQAGCGNYTSLTTYFPENIVVSNGVTLPIWAGVDPSTWTESMFNVQEAQNITGPDLHLNSSNNDPEQDRGGSLVGPIIGGILGGLGAVLVFVSVTVAYMMYGQRKQKSGKITLGSIQHMLGIPMRIPSVQDLFATHNLPSSTHPNGSIDLSRGKYRPVSSTLGMGITRTFTKNTQSFSSLRPQDSSIGLLYSHSRRESSTMLPNDIPIPSQSSSRYTPQVIPRTPPISSVLQPVREDTRSHTFDENTDSDNEDRIKELIRQLGLIVNTEVDSNSGRPSEGGDTLPSSAFHKQSTTDSGGGNRRAQGSTLHQ